MKKIFALLVFTSLTLSLQTCNRSTAESKPTIESAESNQDFIDLAVDRIKRKTSISPEQESAIRKIMAEYNYAEASEAKRTELRREVMSAVRTKVLTPEQVKMMSTKKE